MGGYESGYPRCSEGRLDASRRTRPRSKTLKTLIKAGVVLAGYLAAVLAADAALYSRDLRNAHGRESHGGNARVCNRSQATKAGSFFGPRAPRMGLFPAPTRKK